MTVTVCNHPFAYEVECVVRMFYPGEKIAVERAGEQKEPEGGLHIRTELAEGPGGALLRVRLENCPHPREMELPAPAGDKDRERMLGVMLYRLLGEETGKRPPWGILTGVRPVRLCRSMAERGLDRGEIGRILGEDYLAAPEKVALALETGEREQEILAKARPKGFSLYIAIPFCPTRCLYCSFVSHAIAKAAKLLPDYLDCLCRELEAVGRLAGELGLELQTVYMGGGTPTTLEEGDLERILGAVEANFDRSRLLEYTVEAGRPDTITREKLAALRRCGVDRISINPQTMNEEVLRAIGREHTAGQIRESYQMAREAGFRAINMDLIAGLPGDGPESFLSTLDQVLEMAPENITVHTLTVKRSSALRSRTDAWREPDWDLSGLLDRGRKRMKDRGYGPYYLYRQKGTVQNLENAGYSLPGLEGVYNVLIMEEVHTVLAVGAGGVTKLWAPPDRLQRVFNHKYPYEYIGRFDELLSRKAAVKEFYERVP